MSDNIEKNPDQVHFDKMLIKELVWKLDREVWAHVQNPEPNEEWSTSKAREVTKDLLIEYLGDCDKLIERVLKLEEALKEAKEVIGWHMNNSTPAYRIFTEDFFNLSANAIDQADKALHP